MQAASIWEDKIGDGGAAAEVYERVLQIDPGNLIASIELEQLYRQRKSWVKLIELLLARTEFAARRAGAHRAAGAGRRDLRAAARRPGQRLRDAAGGVPRGLLERPGGQGARAAGDGRRQVERAARRLHPGGPGDRRPKQAADLWVKIARWYDAALRHVDYAIASAQQALQLDPAHVGALQALEDFYRKQKRWTRAGRRRWRATPRSRQEPPPRVDILLQLADTYETQIGDAAQAMLAYQRALDTDERCIDAINALERLYRRTQAWDRLVDVLAKKAQVVDDTEQAVKLRLQVGELWEERLGDNDRAVDAYKEVLSVDPQNLTALKALETPVREDRADGGVPRDPRAPARGLVARGRAGRALRADGRRSGRSSSASPTAPPRCWRRSCSSTTATRRPTAIWSGSTARSASGRPWSTPTASTSCVTNDPTSASSSTRRWGRSTRRSCAISIAPSRRTATCSRSSRTMPTRWRAWRACTRRSSSGTAPSRSCGGCCRSAADAEAEGRPQLPPGRIFDEQMKDPETAEEYLVEALSQDPAHVPSMLALLGIYKRRGDWLKAAQLMVRAEAAHRATRWRRRACCTRRARSTRTSSATRRRPPSCSRGCSRSIPSTSRPPSRWRSSTSGARSGRRWCRSSTCWCARPSARPTAS